MGRRTSDRKRWPGCVLAALVILGGVAPAACQVDLEALMTQREKEPETLAPTPAGTPLEGVIDRAAYRLGPGDRLTLWLSGEKVETIPVEVTPEGVVLLDPAGPIPVGGRTIDEAEEAVQKALAPYFRNVTLRLQLTEVRQFRVHVLGEVKSPGAYLASAAERVASAIEKAGGVTPIGSRRNIVVERNDRTRVSVDLVSYEILGRLDGNPWLREGDVVHVPPEAETVRVMGSVFLPDWIELRPGETVEDLLELAGGLEPGAALDRAEIERFREDRPWDTERLPLDLTGIREGLAPDARIPLRDGDRLYVRSIPKWHDEHSVLVTGEVNYPGWYAIGEERELLSEIVQRAGGFTPLAALREATLVRAERDTVVDREYLRLQNMPVADMTKTEYEYFKFRSRERRGQMVADFVKLFEEGDRTHDLVLRGGDMVNVPRKPLSVGVEGQVASPGHVIYVPDRDVDFYVSQAGGYSWNADRGRVRVIKVQTGEWKWPDEVKVVEPGDTIWIPEKREIEWWPLFKDLTRVLAELATVYLVVDTAAHN